MCTIWLSFQCGHVCNNLYSVYVVLSFWCTNGRDRCGVSRSSCVEIAYGASDVPRTLDSILGGWGMMMVHHHVPRNGPTRPLARSIRVLLITTSEGARARGTGPPPSGCKRIVLLCSAALLPAALLLCLLPLPVLSSAATAASCHRCCVVY